MAQVPGIFNAAQFFGSTNPNKDQHDSFWDQPSASINHPTGAFNGNVRPIDPFVSNAQEFYEDGWEAWPDTDLLNDDSAMQDHVLNGISPDSEQLVVPDHEDSQTSSSSEDSTPPGMDTELSAWVEEETMPYGYAPYTDSGASFFNGEINSQQPNMAQNGRSYASVCQAGTTAAPVQDADSSWHPNHNNYQGHWTSPPSQQVFNAQQINPEVGDTQENAPTVEPWNHEPELGSWSPVFNRDDDMPQQQVPSLTSQPPQFSDHVQELQANAFQPSQQLDAHVPQGEADSSPAVFFGRDKEQHGMGWSALTETDIQQADLWENLPDLCQAQMVESPFRQNALVEQSPSGAFQDTLVAEPDKQHSVEHFPGVESPSGFFQISSSPEPPINNENAIGLKMFQPNFNAESMHNDPVDLTAPEESPSVEPVHQDFDSVIEESFSVDRMQPPPHASSFAENEAWSSHQGAGYQMYNPNTFYDQQMPPLPQMESDMSQEEKAAAEEVQQPLNPPSEEVQPWQQPLQSASLISEPATSFGAPSNFYVGPNSATTDSLHMLQVSEPPKQFSQQKLQTAAEEIEQPPVDQVQSWHPEGRSISPTNEQETPVVASSNLYLGPSIATTESVHMAQVSEPPKQYSHPELQTTAEEIQPPQQPPSDEVQPWQVQSGAPSNLPHNSATTESAQLLQLNVYARTNPEQVSAALPIHLDSLQDSHAHVNSVTESSQPNLLHTSPSASCEQSDNANIPVQQDSLQDSLGHKKTTTESSEPLQLNIPARTSPEQSEKRDISVEPDSPRDALQVAFLQKQLAGKAPAPSPRTSLWMNSSVLPTPCVLAPAAIVTPVETPELRGSAQAPSAYKQASSAPVGLTPAPTHSEGTVLPAAPTQPEGTASPTVLTPCEDTVLSAAPRQPQGTAFPASLALHEDTVLPAAHTQPEGTASLAALTPHEDTALPAGPRQPEGTVLPAGPRQPEDTASPAVPTHSDGTALPAAVSFNEGAALPAALSFNETTSSVSKTNVTTVPKPLHSSVHQVPAVEPPTVAPKQEQKTESANPMSLAALLQGGQNRPKKKASQPSGAPSPHTDAGSSEIVSNPPPSNSFTDNPQSGLPLNPVSSDDQLPYASKIMSSQNSFQQIENQPFDSAGRTGELQHSHDRDYSDPYSRERPRSREDSYYQDHQDSYDRRDPYYHRDQRDSYNSQNRRDPYDYEPDRREPERSYYDMRQPEKRHYDRRREYDRRESDYSRRSHDSAREYDRRGYDGRDYGNRDSYDNRDSYYGYGYSPRQGRRGYDDGRGSREDVYRGLYNSGRSTPSSQDRNSPAPYDHSASPYASQQYGYPSYTDTQSMDLYQYQYMMYLYQFHPQHYEQYCHQLGYYSSEYTPEQLAQYYGGYGYENAQPTEQAALAEVPQPEPERFTPLLYRVQHPLVRFSGGRLLSLIGSEDSEIPKCTVASVQMVFTIEEIEVIKLFPGPLSSRYSSRTEVMTFCEKRSCDIDMSADGVVKSLVWKILANLVKHNGAFVASDLADVIMQNWRSSNTSEKNEFLAPESLPPSQIDTSQHVMIFREMLLAGATKDALEYSMKFRLWGHAMMLASKLDKKVQQDVSSRFMKTMTDFDPIRTVYDHLSGRQPVAVMTPDDWQRSLAAMVANPPRQHPQCIKKNITCLGDTLMSSDQVWAAHLCYLLAGENFGFPTEEKTKMALIGINHRTNTISGQNIPLENLQMMEVLEYAISLSNEEFFIPVLQSYKFLHANKLAEAGFNDEALHYAELIGHTIIKHPTNANVTLVKNVRELTDRLHSDTQESADLMEMLDKVLQTKEIGNSSQISSSVTESESEVEEPLAESSTSFFSGYDPSVNTPKHQTEQIEDVQHQLSYTEPSASSPQVPQEPTVVDYHRDSWSNGMPAGDNQETFSGVMNAQPTQPELPPTMVPAQAPEPVSYPPFFVPGPPMTQPVPVQNEQSETIEEQPVYGRQWSEGARFEEPQKVEPPPPNAPKKTETKPKPDEKKKKNEAKRGSPIGGWISGFLSKMLPRGPNEMILPDDKKKSIYWDEDLKRWVNTEEDEQEKAPPPPPPSDMQLSGGGPPMMPFGNAPPATLGLSSQTVGSPSFPSPGAPQQVTPGGNPVGMATPPAVSKFSRKAYGGGRLAKKYVDVLNPTGQSSNGPSMLPSSLLPSFPGPSVGINPATLFVPSPVTASTDDNLMNDPQTATEPVVANPGSRPSSRNDEGDGADQQSQHSRSSSVSLTSAEVRSYMMPQIPDPPPQNTAPMFFDPSAFSQPKAQASPRKSRYPGQVRK